MSPEWRGVGTDGATTARRAAPAHARPHTWQGPGMRPRPRITLIATPGSVRPGAAPARAHREPCCSAAASDRGADEMMTALGPGVRCTRRPVHRPIVPRLRLGW